MRWMGFWDNMGTGMAMDRIGKGQDRGGLLECGQ